MEGNDIKSKKPINSPNCYCINLENMTIRNIKRVKPNENIPNQETNIITEKKIKTIHNNCLTRKTLRGRKEKISLPKNILKCEICLGFCNSSKELTSCFKCKCLFHYSCYNQCESFKLEEKTFYKCFRCSYAIKMNIDINDFYCFICGNSNGILNKNHKNR